MPLRSTDETRLVSALDGRLPGATLSVKTLAGGTTSVVGYIKRESAGVTFDQFGEPKYEAVLHVRSGSVSPGDEIEQAYVVWESLVATTFPRFGMRELPEFVTWTRTRKNVASVDDDTEISTYGDVDSPVDAYLADRNAEVRAGEGQVTPTHSVAFIVKAGTVQVGDDLSKDQERYEIYAIERYGPYERALGEAA